MRGKQALYGYLHGISPAATQGCAHPALSAPNSICGLENATITTGLSADNKTFAGTKMMFLLQANHYLRLPLLQVAHTK
jgi:hypothetical protein